MKQLAVATLVDFKTEAVGMTKLIVNRSLVEVVVTAVGMIVFVGITGPSGLAFRLSQCSTNTYQSRLEQSWSMQPMWCLSYMSRRLNYSHQLTFALESSPSTHP